MRLSAHSHTRTHTHDLQGIGFGGLMFSSTSIMITYNWRRSCHGNQVELSCWGRILWDSILFHSIHFSIASSWPCLSRQRSKASAIRQGIHMYFHNVNSNNNDHINSSLGTTALFETFHNTSQYDKTTRPAWRTRKKNRAWINKRMKRNEKKLKANRKDDGKYELLSLCSRASVGKRERKTMMKLFVFGARALFFSGRKLFPFCWESLWRWQLRHWGAVNDTLSALCSIVISAIFHHTYIIYELTD